VRSISTIPLRALVPLLAAALLLGGCDAGEKDEPAPRPVETADPLPKLPREWRPHANRRAGFAIGVPPRWSVRDRRRSSLFRSPDRLVAVSVSVDRSEGGLALPVDEFAARVADALPDLKRLEVDKPRPFHARYEAAGVSATGTAAKGDVRQKLLVVVERREGFATYTVVVARNAKRGAKEYRDELRRMLRSLRGRPASS
jgi:hypothetical protein